MSNTLLLKRSSSTGHAPTTSQLSLGEVAVNTFDGILYFKKNNGADAIVSLSPGSSVSNGGAGIDWQPVAGIAPTESYENTGKVFIFDQGLAQALQFWFRIPNSYQSGAQIKLNLGHYSPGSSNNFKLQTVTTLIRPGTDAITSTTNQYTSTNGDQALTSANLALNISYDLTSSSGQVNSVSVAANNFLMVKISRVATTGTDDTNGVRLVPGFAEMLFS